ncbi:LysR family transcriptional regulator [Duganella sp. Dugasp56]|uniref:LysR family transcriptional regulator n=1 Tax=Duganella sp. Dugasp56 TaxID=3243046 RepID=UPI0039B08A41
MEIKQLQLLAELVDTGSLSKVSAARGIAQSALSKQIATLEKEFGAKLFYRTGRGVLLTEFGLAILPSVEAVLAAAEQLKNDIRMRASVPSGVVRLAMQASVTQFLVGTLYARVRRDYPEIELQLMEGFSGKIEDWLANGQVDVAIFSRYGGHGLRLDETLTTNDLYLIGPVGDRLTSQQHIRFADLANVPLVLPGLPDGLRMMLAELAKKQGVALNIALEVNSLTAMKEIVASGLGYTILTQQAVLAEIRLQRLQTCLIVEPNLSRTLFLATSAQRPFTSAGRAIVGLIRDIVGDRENAGQLQIGQTG